MQFSEQEKELYIDYMLKNEELELLLKKWKRKKGDSNLVIDIINMLAYRDTQQGGLILSVTANDVPKGSDSVQFYIPELYPDVTLNNILGKDNQKYVMGFTSKERFQVCNDTSGLVMFIGDVFQIVEKKNEVEGIVLNWNKEEMVIGKDMIRAVLYGIEELGNS